MIITWLPPPLYSVPYLLSARAILLAKKCSSFDLEDSRYLSMTRTPTSSLFLFRRDPSFARVTIIRNYRRQWPGDPLTLINWWLIFSNSTVITTVHSPWYRRPDRAGSTSNMKTALSVGEKLSSTVEEVGKNIWVIQPLSDIFLLSYSENGLANLFPYKSKPLCLLSLWGYRFIMTTSFFPRKWIKLAAAALHKRVPPIIANQPLDGLGCLIKDTSYQVPRRVTLITLPASPDRELASKARKALHKIAGNPCSNCGRHRHGA